jgi:hypothetical protein
MFFSGQEEHHATNPWWTSSSIFLTVGPDLRVWHPTNSNFVDLPSGTVTRTPYTSTSTSRHTVHCTHRGMRRIVAL